MSRKKKQKPVALKGEKKNDYPAWILIALTLLCYLRVVYLDVTQLDDTIFINDKHEFISRLKNIPAAFTQGCFNEKDIYYRPLLLVYFMLLYPFSSPPSVAIYHFGSLAFHLLNVFLLFNLLIKITGNRKHSFLLSSFFAFHPALTMAVAWIPGINDLILSTFALCYFLSLLKITGDNPGVSEVSGKRISNTAWKYIFLNTFFLALALFTKETGSFLPLGAGLLLWFRTGLKNFGRKLQITLAFNAGVWLLWFFARSRVLSEDAPLFISTDMLSQVMEKSTGLIQYFGKCILPFNLVVFPTIESTNTIWGIAALLLMAFLIALNKKRNVRQISLGAAWFVLFLLPIIFVPNNINDQLFEHRLYLPMIGVLFLIHQTNLFHFKPDKKQTIVVAAICLTWIILMQRYIPHFKDTFSFWNSAVAASPENAYANKLLGIKLAENDQKQEAISYIKKALWLDSTQRYVSLFMARLIYVPQQKWDSAQYMLEREIQINPKFYETYMELAHVCVERKNLECAEKNIVKYLEFNPRDEAMNSNLVLLYRDQKKYTQALEQVEKMNQMGMLFDEATLQMIKNAAKNE